MLEAGHDSTDSKPSAMSNTNSRGSVSGSLHQILLAIFIFVLVLGTGSSNSQIENGPTRVLNLCESADGASPEYFEVPSGFGPMNGNNRLMFRLANAGFQCEGPTETLNFGTVEDGGGSIPRAQKPSAGFDNYVAYENGNSNNNDLPSGSSAIPVSHSYDSLNSHRKESAHLTGGRISLPLPPLEATSPFFFTDDGFIVYGNDVYHPNEYCLTRNSHHQSKQTFSVNLCLPDCENSNSSLICINKCCPFGQSIDLTTRSCANSGNHIWALQNVYKSDSPAQTAFDTHDLGKIPIEQVTFHMNIAWFPSNCPEDWVWLFNFNRDMYYEHRLMPNSQFRVLRDGRLLSYNELRRKLLPMPISKGESDSDSPNQYVCMDGIQNFGVRRFYSGHPEDEILIQCIERKSPKTEPGRELYYGPVHILVLFLSSTFLLITAFIYYLSMKKEKASASVHGWTVLCQIVSMFFTYIFLGTTHIFSLFSDQHLNTKLCVLNGILSHFFTLSSFFWMTALDFDIWRTFRSINSCRHSKGKKSLVYYVLFALGLPAVIIAISLWLEYAYRDTGSDFITPEYGRQTCYMSDAALGYYVYYIIGFLLSCNVILMSLTFKNIYQARASTQTVLHKSRTMERQQSSYKLFAKLLIVMGVTWILEVISWIFYEQIEKCSKRHWIRLFFDIINYLQPVAIFVIFVCKRKTLYILATRFMFVRRVNPSWATSSKKSILSTRSSTRQTSRKITNVTGTGTTTCSIRSPMSPDNKHRRNEQLIALKSFNGTNGLKKEVIPPERMGDSV